MLQLAAVSPITSRRLPRFKRRNSDIFFFFFNSQVAQQECVSWQYCIKKKKKNSMLTLHVYGSENYTVKKKWIQALFSIRQLDLQCKSSLINHLTLLSLSGLLTGGCISRRRLPGATVTAHSS